MTQRLRTSVPSLAALLTLAALCSHPAASAQTIPDPANLTGEHIAPPALADTLPINHGTAALQQLLLKLNTRASLMLIVAHPDDEDGGMLTYESRGVGARVAMLTLTRGEGGQNLMSADFNDALGLIRTQELLAEDRYTGTDQMFGTEADFGFSKTREETLEKWSHERVLYDAVRAVRLYRPLVVASVFLGEPTDGHGHHQVSGEIAQEVFAAAADPSVFPEMGLPAWAPLKLYVRVPFAPVNAQGMYDYATGKYLPPQFRNYYTGTVASSEPEANVEIHEGEPATINGRPALGMDGLSYVQFARKGLGLQKSQIGPGVRLASAGRSDSGYVRYGSRVPGLADQGPGDEPGFFSGIDTSLAGMATLAPSAAPDFRADLRLRLNALGQVVARAQMSFDPAQPQASAPALAQAMLAVDSLISHVQQASLAPAERFDLLHELRLKRVQLNDALAISLDLSLTAHIASKQELPHGWLVPGSARIVALRIHAPETADLDGLAITGPRGELKRLAPPSTGEHAEDLNLSATIDLPHDTPVTRPYFSRPNPEQPFYNISQPDLRNAAATPAPLVAAANFTFQGASVRVESTVSAGSDLTPATLVPALSVSVNPSIGVESTAPGDQRPLSLTSSVETEAPTAASFLLRLPAGWSASPNQVNLTASDPGASRSLPATLKPGALSASIKYRIQAVATADGKSYAEGVRAAGYPGLTATNFYTPATYTAVAVNVRTAPGLRVGYLPGTGDDVPAFLPNLGITPTILTLADLIPGTLDRFDTVVLGVRAYAAHPELAGDGSKPLLDFARQGGTVLVQYNNSVYGASSAPAPITVPGDPGHNVVVEADPVTLLAPDATLLSWPNRISPADFNGWVEERGHGFATTWDRAYTALLAMHDPGQDPQRGGLLVADVGRGHYIYCALALYRQLPEGVPGAYRLLANLLSLPKAKGLTRIRTDGTDKNK